MNRAPTAVSQLVLALALAAGDAAADAAGAGAPLRLRMASTTQVAQAEPLPEQARRAVAAQDLPRAEALLRRALAADATDAQSRFLLARVLSWRRDFPGAHREFDLLLSRSPDNADYLLGKAQAYTWSGQPLRALPLLERARGLAPGYFDVWQAEVQAYMATGEPADREAARALAARSSHHLPAEQSSRLAALADPAPRAPRGYTDIALGAGYHDLDREQDPWSALELDVAHRFAGGSTLYGAARASKRFDEEDRLFVAGLYHPVAPGWLLQVEAQAGPGAVVVPRWSLYGRVSRELGAGWNLAAALRRSQYRVPQVDTGNLTVERYWSAFRAAYSVYASSVEDADPVYSHAAEVDYFYGDLSFVGVSGARGKEAEFISDSRLEVRRTSSVALRGRHWLDPSWAIEYTVDRSNVEAAHTRYGVRLGLRYRY